MTGGAVIRLIDVVLIILFGFLFIADYQEKSYVPLPRVETTEKIDPDDETVYRVLEIFRGSKTDAPYYWYGNTGGKDRVLRRIGSPQDLVLTLQKEVEMHGENLQVVIVPLAAAKVQWAIDAFDICRELGIQQPILRVERGYVHMTSRG
jgi:biopolymer transport protein ExbD